MKRKAKVNSNLTNSIKFWPKFERPRELLLDIGPESVSDAGLIAILLRTGKKNKDAVSLARDLIRQFGGLRGLFHTGRDGLMKVNGLGNAKIAQLMVVKELAKRLLKEEIIGNVYVESDKDVLDYLSLTLKDQKEEFFKVIYLNKTNVILSIYDLARGTVDEATVYPRDVVKRGIELNAAGAVFVHNHPSGNLNPSQFDMELSKELISACRTVGIAPIDHIIVSPEGHVSLKKRLGL